MKEICARCKTWTALPHSTLCAECTAQPCWELRSVGWYWDCGFPGCGLKGLAPQLVAMLWDGRKWVRHQCIHHPRPEAGTEAAQEKAATEAGA